jgi:hypothetical protein
MNRVRVGVIAFVVLAAVVDAAGAAGGPREPFTPEPVADLEVVEPAVWSKRLLGRFIFDGLIYHYECVYPDGGGSCTPINEWQQPVEGKGDCIDFADGPGLQCVINMIWPEMWRENGKAQLGGVSDLTPAMTLAGFVTTTAGGIRVLLVNDRGLAHPGALILKGSTASAKPPCVNLPGMTYCEQKFRVEARPGAKNIFVSLSTETRFIRSKLDRKLYLDPGERSTESAEERIDVSFALRREPGGQGAATTSAAP